MSKRKLMKVAAIALGAVTVLATVKVVVFARSPHHGSGQRVGDDPTGSDVRPGVLQRWQGMTKDEFDGRARERFARIDRNNDGIIDTAEIETALSAPDRGGWGRGRGEERADRRGDGPTSAPGGPPIRGRFDRLDANRDGKVTREEALDAMRRLFGEADLDGDGRITDADLPPPLRGRNAIADAREPMAGDRGHDGRRGQGRQRGSAGAIQALYGADTNRDNVITVEEALAHAGRRFDRADRTKDGVLDGADRTAFAKEMLDYRVQRFLHHFGAKDGKVTREQFMAKVNRRFAEMDLNGDGKIVRDEMPPRGHHWRGGRLGGGDGPGPGPTAPGPTEPGVGERKN